MMRAGTRRLIPFFWQAVFILLPVTVLAVVSLFSLHRDAQRAEQDARSRAAQDVQSLARATRESVSEQLQRFLSLQNEWEHGVFAAGQPAVKGAFPDIKLKSDIEKWERDYPGLTIAQVVTPGATLLTDGHQIAPPEIPEVPTPPDWYRDLSPRQRELWERLRRAVDANEKNESIQKAYDAFIGSQPSVSAGHAAFTLEQPATNVIGWSDVDPTETGLSFEEIACYELLSARDARLTDSLVQSVWWRVIDHPSFISARLLEKSEGLTNNAGAALSQNVYWIQQYWNEQSTVRAWLDQLRGLPALTNWNIGTSRAVWADGSDSSALALFEPCESAQLTGHGYMIYFVPREVLQAIFARALQENEVFISDYEAAAVTVEGESNQALFPSPHGRGSIAPDWQLLSNASQTAGAAGMLNPVHFAVALYLTNREQMLSAEHRRFKLFALLILGAIFSAIVGLLATWRAFYRQQQLNEMKINFVSSVSHELRAPIASVRLMAENLERGKIPDAPRQNEYFRFIVQECRRLSSLIENVLDFSRIEQGRKQYEFEPANLVVLVQTTVKIMEPYAAEKGVRLEIASSERSNIELEADSQAIQQALVNLIDNAIKHSPKGETVTVGIKWQTAVETDVGTTPTVFLFVADHGPGIPPEEHEKIFERFYRRGTELRRETQGVGIGLSVVQHIIQAHSGHVRVQSEPGQGSRFTIELPVRNHHE